VQAFVERVIGHELIELAEDRSMTAERQIRVDPCLNGSLPPIGEPGRHWRDEVVVRQISENVAAPERSCLIELAHGLSQCAVGQQPFATVDASLERGRVERVRSDRQAIPALVGDHDLTGPAAVAIGFQCPAQVKDVGLDGPSRAGRDSCGPQCIGQLVDGEAGIIGEQQSRQDRPLLSATQRQRNTGTSYPKRPQDPERVLVVRVRSPAMRPPPTVARRYAVL
jgi:hypothetical protein